jgi:hypothetical protein
VIAECPGQAWQEVASLPFHIEREMTGGFGLTVGKLVLSGRIDEVVSAIRTNIRHI